MTNTEFEHLKRTIELNRKSLLKDLLSSELDSLEETCDCSCCTEDEQEEDADESEHIPSYVLKLHLDKATPVFSYSVGEGWVVYVKPSSFALTSEDSDEFAFVKKNVKRPRTVESTFHKIWD